jgi:hypothetical protein
MSKARIRRELVWNKRRPLSDNSGGAVSRLSALFGYPGSGPPLTSFSEKTGITLGSDPYGLLGGFVDAVDRRDLYAASRISRTSSRMRRKLSCGARHMVR